MLSSVTNYIKIIPRLLWLLGSAVAVALSADKPNIVFSLVKGAVRRMATNDFARTLRFAG